VRSPKLNMYIVKNIGCTCMHLCVQLGVWGRFPKEMMLDLKKKKKKNLTNIYLEKLG
jgi:hypothetical protein